MEQESELATTLQIPMAHPYLKPKYYVRACYRRLYKEIVAEIEKRGDWLHLTITGTPGIGKSLFCNYVFNQLRQESSPYQDRTFILASFDENQKFIKAVVYVPGKDELKIPTIEKYHIASHEYEKAIHLYDGAPRRVKQQIPTIVFTSPNYGWFKHIEKIMYNRTRYMETWDYDELLKAVKKLELQISTDEIYKRYQLFGGVARYCIDENEEAVIIGERALHRAINAIDSFDDMEKCLNGSEDHEKIAHRLFHYVPQKNPADADIKFASNQVAQSITDRFNRLRQFDRWQMMKMLEGAYQGTILRAWLFEGEVHSQLSSPVGFHGTARSLGSQNDLKIDLKSGYTQLKASSTVTDFIKDYYLRPTECNFESIDSYYVTNNGSLYLFQATISPKHPVNAKGILRVLKSLKVSADKAILIFVVPQDVADSYTKQKIVVDERIYTELKQVPGIKGKKAAKLRKIGIRTLEQLRHAYENGERERISFVLFDTIAFVKSSSNNDEQKILKSIYDIAQYVLPLYKKPPLTLH